MNNIRNSLQSTPLFPFLFRDTRLSDQDNTTRKEKKHIFPEYSVCMLEALTELKGGMGAELSKKHALIVDAS